MNAQLKEILGVDTDSGVASLRDAINELVGRQKQREEDEQRSREKQDKSDAERERLRSELRKRDEAWRASVDERLASQDKQLAAIRVDLAGLPAMMDTKIAACDTSNHERLEPALIAARDYASERAEQASLRSYLSARSRTLMAVIALILFVGIASALAVGRHDIAAALAALLAAESAVVVISYGYGSRPKR